MFLNSVRQAVLKNPVTQVLLVILLYLLSIRHTAPISITKKKVERAAETILSTSEQRRVSLPSPTVNSTVSLLSPNGRDGHSRS